MGENGNLFLGATNHFMEKGSDLPIYWYYNGGVEVVCGILVI